MNSQNQITDRLQQQKDQIARMLSPGSKRLPATRSAWDYSPVAPDFGGRKFQLAAKKMRILDQEKLGYSRSEITRKMAAGIQAKFKNVQGMLHISSLAGSKNNPWSEVEQVLPNQAPGQAETTSDPDALRRGSIIQQFSTFPKPGQSLETFKDQAARRPTARRQEAGPPKKTSPAPRDRLFSRVQELTTGQKENKILEQPAAEVTAAEPQPAPGENVQKQLEQIPASAPNPVSQMGGAENKMIEQAEPVSNIGAVPAVTDEALPAAEIKITAQLKAEIQTGRTAIHAEDPAAVPVQNPPIKAEPVSVSKSRPVRESALPDPVTQKIESQELTSTRAGKIELETARPTQRQKTEGPKLPTAVPVAKIKKSNTPDVHLPEAKRYAPAARPNISGSPAHSIQRQPEPEKPAPEMKEEPDSFRPEMPAPAEYIPTQQETPPVKVQPAAGQQAEMPLRKHLERQRGIFADSVRHTQPIATRDGSRSKFTSIQPRLAEFKYQAAAQNKETGLNTIPRANPQPTPHLIPQRQTEPPALHYPAAGSTRREMPAAPIRSTPPQEVPERDLIRTAVQKEPAARTAMTPQAPGPAAGLGVRAVTQQAVPAPAAPGNVIQRLWQEHNDVQHDQGQPPGARSEAENLDHLAEKIFPLVKQLLELETERTGSRFG